MQDPSQPVPPAPVPYPVETPQIPPAAPVEPVVTAAPIPVVAPQVAYTEPSPMPAEPIVSPAPAAPQPMAVPAVEWQASEYITREKNTIWFVALGLIAAVLCALALFVIKDITFAILVVVMAVAVGLFARRPARDMLYQLTHEGLSVNGKFFSFHDYRAFGVIQEGAIYSITVLPIKRFAPSVNVYFPPEYGERIVDIFGSALPMEDVKRDVIDRLSEKLHF